MAKKVTKKHKFDFSKYSNAVLNSANIVLIERFDHWEYGQPMQVDQGTKRYLIGMGKAVAFDYKEYKNSK